MPVSGNLWDLAESLEKEQRRNLVPNEVADLKEKLREQHESLIDALPAGSLGESGVEMGDRTTWWQHEDEGVRDFARDFLGITGPESNQGLSKGQRAVLLEASDAEIERTTSPEAIRQFKKDHKAFEEAASSIWSSYALQYPEGAADPNGARSAMTRLLQNTSLSKGQLASLATGSQEERNKILDMVWEEQTSPGSVTNRGRSGMPSQHDDDNRTAGFSTGSSGVYGGGQQREVQPESFGESLRDWKKRGGWTK